MLTLRYHLRDTYRSVKSYNRYSIMNTFDNFYLYLQSTSPLRENYYNNSFEFTADLPSIVNLDKIWECALLELHCKLRSPHKYGDYIDVLCDAIESMPTDYGCQPIFSRIMIKNQDLRIHKELSDPRYVKVKLFSIKSLRFQLAERASTTKLDNKATVFIVLHFRRKIST